MFKVRQKRDKRFQRHQSAWIMLDGGFAKRECQVADVSRSGAKLVIKAGDELPKRFTMTMVPNGGAARQCQVVWRNGRMAGVKFC